MLYLLYWYTSTNTDRLPRLEGAVAGTPLLRLEAEDDLQELKATVMQDLEQVMSQLSTSGKGVHVQVS